MELTLDTQAILQQIREGKALTGKDGALAPLIKQLTEAALQAEIESHLTQDLNRNRKEASNPYVGSDRAKNPLTVRIRNFTYFI